MSNDEKINIPGYDGYESKLRGSFVVRKADIRHLAYQLLQVAEGQYESTLPQSVAAALEAIAMEREAEQNTPSSVTA